MQKGKRWEVSLLIRGKGRGFWANVPPSLLPPDRRTGEGRRRVAGGPIRALWATAAAGIEGERRREVWGGVQRRLDGRGRRRVEKAVAAALRLGRRARAVMA